MIGRGKFKSQVHQTKTQENAVDCTLTTEVSYFLDPFFLR